MNTPLFDWLKTRSCGVLLHPTSLPGDFGTGDIGQAAHRFLDWMTACGLKYWQVLPLGPTGFGDSPYQAYSSHALNPLLLAWEEFFYCGYLTPEDLRPLMRSDPDKVDFDYLKPIHASICAKVVKKGLQDPAHERPFRSFLKNHSHWVDSWSLFTTFKKVSDNKPWYEWRKEWRDYETASQIKLPAALLQTKKEASFLQYLLYTQWNRLKEEAAHKEIRIIGDIPIYVAPDSVDVWRNPEVFRLGKDLRPSCYAGVPPDYFNSEGQFWGNPIYDWKHLSETGFEWWMDRIRHSLSLFDIVRLDHFRAMEAFWCIPKKAKSAKEGKWETGPGLAFFEKLKSEIPDACMILEDLGLITPEVTELRDQSGFPGLAVLQFAFGGGSDNFYLPHNLVPNSVVYTGTHDNDTSLGWYRSSGHAAQDHMRRYLRVDGSTAPWDLIRSAWSSVARLCVVPLQDFLSLGTEARFNTPGTATGNWRWRCREHHLHHFQKESASYLRELSNLYGRS